MLEAQPHTELNASLRLLNNLIYELKRTARDQDHPAARKLLEMARASDAIVDSLPASEARQ